MSKIKILSPAKINLGLLVKEKRPDGYHNIETILTPIRLFDEIILEKRDKGIRLKVTGWKPVSRTGEKFKSSRAQEFKSLSILNNKKNLAFRAAKLFFRKSGIKEGVKITLKKNIPVGAGLGGGSSNAASVLKGLNRLFDYPFNSQELDRLAINLGMDVPFFLRGRPCYATGRGEVLKPIKLPKLYLLLYIPKYSIATKWAYNNLSDLTKEKLSLNIILEKFAKRSYKNLLELLNNSFEPLVFKVHKDLAIIKERFLESGAYMASLSGTGGAVYGLYRKSDLPNARNFLLRKKIKVIVTETAN